MGNYVSKQIQLESETKNLFDKIMNKNTIEKSSIMGLVNKFKALKNENHQKYTTIANRAKTLNDNFKTLSRKGRIKPNDWNKLNQIYAEFEELITV